MTDNKDVTAASPPTDAPAATDSSVNELVNIVDTYFNPVTPNSSTASSLTGSIRTNSPPLMGTHARAAKRRIDSDSGPIRIEGTDTLNQQVPHHYQNIQPVSDDQSKQSASPAADSPLESRESFSAKRDYFEQRFKNPPTTTTYDSPPTRKPAGQKVVTTITTTTTTTPVVSHSHDRTSSSSNESPSVDRVLEQAVELQKMSNINSAKYDAPVPYVIERTEEYQVFLDAVNHEVRRTPSISRTTIISGSRSSHATDLDQAQAEVTHVTDDHEAIQQLTRALQEHNVSTIKEYKRLPSQTNPPTPSVLPTAILTDRTNLPATTNEFAVIDALLNNPVGCLDDRYGSLFNTRYTEIVTNLRSPDYLNAVRQPNKKTKEPAKKKTKEKKPDKKSKKKSPSPPPPPPPPPPPSSSSTAKAVTQASSTSDADAPLLQRSEAKEQPVSSSTVVSEQTPLIDPKEKKKQDKENKKQLKNKSKQKSKNGDYEVLDAIIGSPISLRLPEAYLSKYHVSAPLSQSALSPSTPAATTGLKTTTTTTTTTTATTAPARTTSPAASPAAKAEKNSSADKNQTISHLVKIVHELQLHNAAALVASLNSTPSKASTTIETKQPIIADKRTVPVTHESVGQQPLLEQQNRPVIHHTQPEVRPHSEAIKPRIIYRYIDEHGRLLKISSTPPSQLREQPSQQQYPYRPAEATYLQGRPMAVDDERRHPLSAYEQRAAWHGEPKLPTTVTREDFELRDRRVPHISEQAPPGARPVPVTVDPDYSSKSSSSNKPHRYHYPSQQNVRLAWMPLSYQPEHVYSPTGGVGYDTDSTISERSATYRPYDYGPPDGHYYHPSHRPLHAEYHYNRSSGPSYYSPPPPMPYGGRGISPEYGGVPRNYIEVFRGGDFRETKPSEIYSLPLNEHIRTSPITPSSNRHSRYDQYQSERYGSMSNRNQPSSEHAGYYSNTLPHPRYQTNIPPATVHTSTYYTHRSPYEHRTVQSSPNPDMPNYVRHSKSFDYRPLRTKLQREYKITPNLLVDEWELSPTSERTKYSTTTTTYQTTRSDVSSPDDVFVAQPTAET